MIHFDAVRLRALRGPVVQTVIGLLLLINNFRVLVRERFSDNVFSQGTICMLYCARYRTIVSHDHEVRRITHCAVTRPQAMSSLANITLFSMKFVASRIINLPLSRLPVIHGRPLGKQIQLYVVVPSDLVPPNVGISRSLTRLVVDDSSPQMSRMGSVVDEPAVATPQISPGAHMETELGAELATVVEEESMERLQSALSASSTEAGALPAAPEAAAQMPASPSGSDALAADPGTAASAMSEPSQRSEPAHVSWAEPPAASPSAAVPAETAEVDAEARRDAQARGARGARGSMSGSAADLPRSIHLFEMQAGATAKDAVVIPLATWQRHPLLDVKCLVRVRRSPAYKPLTWCAYVLCCAAMLAAVVENYDRAWLAGTLLAVVGLIQLVEVTRMDRRLFLAVVSVH